MTKVYVGAIQTNFKPKFPTMADEELDVSTKLGKAKKLVKMKNAMAMVYTTQCLSSVGMVNAIFNIQTEAGWMTRRAHQLFDTLKHKYNPHDKC